MSAPTERTWHWSFNKPIATLWPVFADTARFNEAAGFPSHQIREEAQPDGAVRYFGSARLDSYALEWEEIPVNWVDQRWFRHERRFSKGPFSLVIAHVEFEATKEGCLCHYTLQVQPASWIGHLVLLTGFFRKTAKKFLAMAEAARAYVNEEAELPFEFAPPLLASGAAQHSQQLVNSLQESPYHHDLLPRLRQWILERPDVDMWHLRPKALARLWQTGEIDVIEVFLLAARNGLLNLHWELLCPNCRVGKQVSASMDEIPQGSHCSSCNIDYGRNFNRNVELVFQPSRTIRPMQNGEYCLFGPMSTPHIVVQQAINAHSSHAERLELRPGTYRVRTLEAGNDQYFAYESGSLPTVVFSEDHQLSLQPDHTLGASTLSVQNNSSRKRVLIIEHREWMQDVLTASEAIALQCFRDLFDEHILRPGDHVEIDHITLMFTDIKASTSLYERTGDAAAFALVREHFAILATCVRRHNGTIVKTMGDAIMAAFHLPQEAVLCAIAIQQDFAAFNHTRSDSEEKVIVKLGLHGGPCIAVTLNGILDYYGKVANQTARIQSLCEGGDIVLSQALASEPAVAEVLQGSELQQGSSGLKGISGETHWVRLR